MIIIEAKLIEIDRGYFLLNPYCFIQCVGKSKVPDKNEWKTNVSKGINRLVYVIGGEGGYYLRGEKHAFKRGFLYLLPAYENIPTWSSYESIESRLDHTFVNFEMIPPIITKDVIELDPYKDPMIHVAFSMFDKIAESTECRMYNLKSDELYYLKATVIYIINKMVAECNIKMLDDKILISALEQMHKGISTEISIRDIAEKSFMSYDGFIRRFTRALGVTPYTYLKQLRIRTATALRDEGATLEEAAEKCGYSDAASLLHAISSEKALPKIR